MTVDVAEDGVLLKERLQVVERPSPFQVLFYFFRVFGFAKEM